MSAALFGKIALDVVVTVTAIAALVGLRPGREGDAGETPGAGTNRDEPSPAGPQDRTTARDNPFLKRLPKRLGTDLHHLSMADHYVEAHTAAGHALVLIRFSDALAELSEIDGLQLHRSHWVARHAVRRVCRQGRNLVVETIDGAKLPVSRSFQGRVREGGFPGGEDG
nr:LytTR family DNA-binding domain-containing protein [Jiella mangrovi]